MLECAALVSTREKLKYLRRGSTYPDRPRRIDVVETHMSWVFLTDEYAYKLKKPVRYAFLDFSTLASRQRTCQEELRLNRRLAQDVYLGVVPLVRRSDDTLALDVRGQCVDWLVMMRRLPAERMLDRAIRAKRVPEADVHQFARVLADFYQRSPTVQMSPAEYVRRFELDILDNVGELRAPEHELPPALIAESAGAQTDFLRTRSVLLASRARQGRIIEAHGDLRPEHICLGPEPKIIDCMEFKRELRLLDPVDELAFLAMECDRLGAPWIAQLVLDAYGTACGDRPSEALVNFYKSFRACLRAKIAVWHTRESREANTSRWRGLAVRYLALSAQYLTLPARK